jgi:hypothetical protein
VALTLVEAFREVGPLVEAARVSTRTWAREVNARRSAAAECLHRKLQELVRRLRFDRALLEEARQEALLRLARGPAVCGTATRRPKDKSRLTAAGASAQCPRSRRVEHPAEVERLDRS